MFVRELLQNARDAGASRVEFRVTRRQDGPRAFVALTCADDGSGMSFEHAKRYLFRLYASSKENRGDQVGRFGVGFWSILRFSPSRIEIRSCTGSPETAWAIELSGDLATAREWTPNMARGSVVVLEREIDERAPADRAGDEREIRRRLEDAVWQNGRFLRRRDEPRTPLDVLVDGKLIRAEFTLPAPATRFSSGPMRGVVALGSTPGVELFSRGLRVRVAAALDDLLTDDANTRRSRVRFVEMPDAMAPRVLLEDDGLELLLNRSEARDGRRLDRLVTLANDALESLVEQQIALVRPPTLAERVSGISRRLLGDSVVLRILASASIGAVVGLAIVASGVVPSLIDADSTRATVRQVVPIGVPERGPYRDLAARYEGPSVTELASPSAAASADVELRYTPAAERPYLAALRVTLDAWGRPLPEDSKTRAPRPLLQVDECDTGRRGGTRNTSNGPRSSPGCLGFAVHVGPSESPVRLPIPSGHALVRGSLRVDGVAVAPGTAHDGLPTVRVSATNDTLVAYETGPLRAKARGRDAAREDFPVDADIELPTELKREMTALRRLPVAARVARATARVRALVRYSTDRDVAAAHRAALRERTLLVDRALRIGAGDCDVQGAILVAMLAEADVDSRLVVGFVGRDGRANPWLHAWVEWRDEVGQIQVADPARSTLVSPADGANAGAPDEIRVGPTNDTGQGAGSDSDAVDPDTLDPTLAESTSGDANDSSPMAAGGSRESTFDERARTVGIEGYRAALRYVAVAAEASAGSRPADTSPVGQANAPSDPSSTTNRRPSGEDDPFATLERWARWALLAATTTFALVGLVLWWRTRRSGEVELAAPEALTKLLLGALAHPAAFQHVPALFDRPLVPCLHGRSLSLRDARKHSRDGTLVFSASHGPLSLRAARRGTPVVDASHPSGRIVASSLAGLDLDRWERRLQHGDRTPLTMACERALTASGFAWRIVVARDASTGRAEAEHVSALDLSAIGLAPRGLLRSTQDVRIVAIDPNDAVFTSLTERFSTELARDPSIAPLCVFGLIDHLLVAIAAPEDVRARVLEPLARAVVRSRPLPANPPSAPPTSSGNPSATEATRR